jgi:Domain of unknown function (DUF1127)
MVSVGPGPTGATRCAIMLLQKSRALRAALTGLANAICTGFRRAEQRRILSELTPLEWRDLGLHRVRQELNKWPWEQ